MIRPALLALAALAPAVGAAPPARTPPPADTSPSEIVAAAPAGDWIEIPSEDLLVMTLAPDAAAHARRVTIRLIGTPFAQGWVGNVRTLAAAHWWDAASVNRVQDNYVVQWGDATEKKPLPAGLATPSETEYAVRGAPARMLGALGPHQSVAGYDTIVAGFPVRTEGARGSASSWPIHCYGMVGVGRDLSPDTGSGAELYAVIGEAPRHLDRNIALVGRVIEGIEHLSGLPRGTAALGFYETAGERTPIVSVRLARDLPAAERPRFEYLATGSGSFTRYVAARANRRDAFFVRPAGWVDICNVPVPVRRIAAP